MRGLTFHPEYSIATFWFGRADPAESTCIPPHDIADLPAGEHLPAGDRQDEIRELMELSKEVFAEHPVNRKRVAEGKKPATQIWLWGQGNAMQLESYQSLYGMGGGVVSAVDLLKGIAKWPVWRLRMWMEQPAFWIPTIREKWRRRWIFWNGGLCLRSYRGAG